MPWALCVFRGDKRDYARTIVKESQRELTESPLARRRRIAFVWDANIEFLPYLLSEEEAIFRHDPGEIAMPRHEGVA